MHSGIKDKNGVEIKAGDILKDHLLSDERHGDVFVDVEFTKGAFVMINRKDEKLFGEGASRSLIYDNYPRPSHTKQMHFSERYEIVKN